MTNIPIPPERGSDDRPIWRRGETEPGKTGKVPKNAGEPVCGARTPRGEWDYCQSALRMGNGRCRVHSGGAARGAATPSWKHGGYASTLPRTMGRDLRRLMEDPDALSVAEEVGLLKLRLRQLTGDLRGVGLDVHQWRDFVADVDRVRVGLYAEAPNIERLTSLMDRICAQAHEGRRAESAWSQIENTAETRSRLAEREAKRLLARRIVVTAEQVMALLDGVLFVVKRHVLDGPVIARISEELGGLIEGGARVASIGGQWIEGQWVDSDAEEEDE